MRFASLSVVLLALLGGCSSGPSAPTLEAGTMVVRSLGSWTYGATPRYALAEQYQFAGERAEGWLEPMQQAVSQQLNGRGWQSVPLDEADLWIAIGVAGGKDISDDQIFSRLGMTPGVQASPDEHKGTLVIALLDRKTQKAVWGSVISLASDAPVAESQRQALSHLLAAKLLGSVPTH
ncbi:DUF4136 domain-containing protein [Aeromonas finlandensis]|uniref:DUF4136 domain-containing protein n=1 Tax=Aeromonas finlandensis TaxID=1543375 RepID=UPI00051B893E|nr:DUF4136 domain-containing protein [Aeromonas finlandensis]